MRFRGLGNKPAQAAFSCSIPHWRNASDSAGFEVRILSFNGPMVPTWSKSLTNNRGNVMRVVIGMVAMIALVALAGCQDLKPLQNEIGSLKTQVSSLQSDIDGLKRAASTASQTLNETQRAAQAASNKADQALAAVQAVDQKVASTNEQMDRMFRRTVSK